MKDSTEQTQEVSWRIRWRGLLDRLAGAPARAATTQAASDPTVTAASPWPHGQASQPPDSKDFRPFQPGEIVGGRFEIVREIAQGGMGVVYLATDLKLNQPRALKCAKHGHSGRLTPEARNALQVTHPNVCRMYEIHTAETPEGPVDFLAMEFVEGQTLAHLIEEKGRLNEADARQIAIQICSGLAAAHGQNLLHRDLKPLNVLLTRDAKGETRAVVTDFGLAQPSSVQFAREHSLAGTRAYMAPELLDGSPPSIASDIYALGVTLHEMTTGTLPGRTGAAIPARWRPVIDRCLHKDPAARYGSAASVAAALQGATRLQWLATAAGAAFIVALIIWRTISPATQPARLAILPVDAQNAGRQTESLAQSLTYDLSNRLSHLNPRPPQLVVIPAEETRTVASAPQKAKEALGASHILRVTLTQSGSRLQLQSVILNTATQMPIRETTIELDPAKAGAAVSSLVALVASAFNLPRQARTESVNPAAYADYTAGIAQLRTGQRNYAQAVAAFERAVVADPSSPLPPAGLAEACYVAWVETRDPSWLKRGRESLAVAQRVSPDSLAVRLAAGRLNLVPGAYDRASQEYQRAIQLDSNNSEAWRGLARAYEAMEGRTNDAIAAYLKAIELQPGYYLPHQSLGTYYRQLGNYSEAEKHWRRVVELAPAYFTGRANLGGLYAEMGRWEDSERQLNIAREIEPNSRIALNNLGALYQYMGRDIDAAALFEKSRALGSESHVLLLNLGDSYRRTGQPAKAAQAYARARALAEEALSANPRDAALRSYIAYFALRLGNRTAALRELALALDLSPANKNVIRRAVICYEALGLRTKSLALLQTATPDLLRELGRQPDLAELRRDPRFIALNPNR